MLAALLLFVAPPPAAGGVSLADADAFRVDGHAAHALFRLAGDHGVALDWSVRAANRPDVYEAWVAETRWRQAVWDKVDDVKYPGWNFAARKKLQSLAQLRELLGDEAYYAGALPMPIPTYTGGR